MFMPETEVQCSELILVPGGIHAGRGESVPTLLVLHALSGTRRGGRSLCTASLQHRLSRLARKY